MAKNVHIQQLMRVASLPTPEELAERRKRYNERMKKVGATGRKKSLADLEKQSEQIREGGRGTTAAEIFNRHQDNILSRARYKGRIAYDILDDPNTTDEEIEELKRAHSPHTSL